MLVSVEVVPYQWCDETPVSGVNTDSQNNYHVQYSLVNISTPTLFTSECCMWDNYHLVDTVLPSRQ